MGKETATTPKRGFVSDGENVPEARRRTDDQNVTHLELMLGQIANYCPVISRNTVVKNSTSLTQIWQAIRLHYGFQLTGSHFLDFNSISLNPDERPEDLYQRLISFIEDNLLTTAGRISHHGSFPTPDEELTPSLENMVVLIWLRLIHPDLPQLVKQRYGTELRSQTLATLKPEISVALDSSLDEVHTTADAKILRTTTKDLLTSYKTTQNRETTTSHTTTLIENEKSSTFRDILSRLLLTMKPIDGPPVSVRVDPAPGFTPLVSDQTLLKLGISLEVGRIKNPNKSPVAERAIQELEGELLRQEPGGGPVTPLGLSIATARMNSRVRSHGLSAHELRRRSQVTNQQIPLSDREVILRQHSRRLANHPYSFRSKNHRRPSNNTVAKVGDLVYLTCDGSKDKGRERYIVTSTDDNWFYIRKFLGAQLRSKTYQVHPSECIVIPQFYSSMPFRRSYPNDSSEVSEYKDTDHDIPLTDADQVSNDAAPSQGQSLLVEEPPEVDPPPDIPELLSQPVEDADTAAVIPSSDPLSSLPTRPKRIVWSGATDLY
ncbi:hypothetical protein LOTGIDRAFT_174331 [Lottia gigantea]|uniref:Integrase catalytic domain-containing protein n=1 Tax=Lottia gigantea TaxID=225164 RepID=V4AX35_LOTGI|nr:hypothetical protein LOTGIDRAFT_174331 [Lottia gigantea]ESO98116.1 hypothetical protein LOTGIDRAFT_174331 [Lottia gigantea]